MDRNVMWNILLLERYKDARLLNSPCLSQTHMLSMYIASHTHTNSLPHLPYSKLGIITGPYFIGCEYGPSFCTIKSAARLNCPFPPF